jgi:aryl-alcohol dehydrogenase-like predicted oxidoreductase
LETIDAIYLHSAIRYAFAIYKTRPAVLTALAKAVDFLEHARAKRWIRYYGISSGEDEGVNAALDSMFHIQLEALIVMAQEASVRHGHDRHGFRLVMFYYNTRLHGGSSLRSQVVQGQEMTALEAMQHLSIVPVPIRLMDPDKKRAQACAKIAGLSGMSDFERRLYLSASAVADRGVSVIGQGSPSHVGSNLKLMQRPLLPLDELNTCLKVKL